jgi:hypothetical protein
VDGGLTGLCAIQNKSQMAARFLHDRIDLRGIRMESRMPAHHCLLEVFLIAAPATAGQENAHQN